MKILSMNVHSLIETDEAEKLRQFARMVLEEQPDIMGLQEVDQTWNAPVVQDMEGQGAAKGPRTAEASTRSEVLAGGLEGYVACREREGEHRSPVLLRQDNYALRLAACLRELGSPYYWTWIPVKLGYGKYDEGLALFSKTPLLDTDRFFISCSQAYENWKTREILGIRTQAGGGSPSWAYTVHMGWWDDKEEPFSAQWERVEKGLEAKLAQAKAQETAEAETALPLLWLMGDFNSPAEIRGQGYDLVTRWGWKDTYLLAEEKDKGVTVEEEIDGWRERMDKGGTGEEAAPGMRIDYIWCSRDVHVARSQVVCDGSSYPKVSDHNGVMVTVSPAPREGHG